ncbi:MAG: uracil-DNA glycosylase [Ectothiorhodospiraceae bacterium]|nr:uracil-DNA glycosylase [Ectothiorhodospiraceae bacterium]MCH8504469.1 uracil-DNA glycosylase [Ectothiorhodospiraceae bacterium]
MSVDPAKCTACRLSANRQQVVLPDGPISGLLAVGEAPGRQEDAQGVGFVGIAGRNLDRVMAACGVQRDGYARTNIVRCRPPDNRKPRSDEVAACAHWLDQVLRDWQPRVILAVGQSAAERLTPPWSGSYLDHVEQLLAGQIPMPRYQGIPVVPMPHTSPLAWNRRRPDGSAIRDLGKRAVERAVRLAQPT